VNRQDISDFLIHFTKDVNLENSFKRLLKIIRDQALIGGDGFIKGGYKCVCFSEAPLSCLKGGLVNPGYYSKYSPFGILLPKTWLYQKGGRPVIYQPDDEFCLLPENMRWRHVRYEPPKVDFSWEREWRIQTNLLEFQGQDVSIVVPNAEWSTKLIRDYEKEQSDIMQEYSIPLDDENIAQVFYQPFNWRIIRLS